MNFLSGHHLTEHDENEEEMVIISFIINFYVQTQYIKQKVDLIQQEILRLTSNVSAFANTCDEQLNCLVDNLEQGQLSFS